jgi:hypothetical protein
MTDQNKKVYNEVELLRREGYSLDEAIQRVASSLSQTVDSVRFSYSLIKQQSLSPGMIVKARVDNILPYGTMCHVLDKDGSVLTSCLLPNAEAKGKIFTKGEVFEAGIIKGHKGLYALSLNYAKKATGSVTSNPSLDTAVEYLNAAVSIIKNYKQFRD